MNIIQRYQPALSWGRQFDRFLDRNLLDPAATGGKRESYYESNDAWILRLDLPGFSKADIALTVTERNLRLSAETPSDRPFGGTFESEWRLGSDIDSTAVSARLENGVLELTLPKKPEVIAQPTTIEIQ